MTNRVHDRSPWAAPLKALAVGGGMLFALGAPNLAAAMDRETAAGACMMFIQRSLHDPSSAEFEHSRSAVVSINGPNALVLRPVRAKNGFGAIRRSQFGCIVQERGANVVPISVFEVGKQSKAVNAKARQLGLAK